MSKYGTVKKVPGAPKSPGLSVPAPSASIAPPALPITKRQDETIQDVIRRETDDGLAIVQFYVDLMQDTKSPIKERREAAEWLSKRQFGEAGGSGDSFNPLLLRSVACTDEELASLGQPEPEVPVEVLEAAPRPIPAEAAEQDDEEVEHLPGCVLIDEEIDDWECAPGCPVEYDDDEESDDEET